MLNVIKTLNNRNVVNHPITIWFEEISLFEFLRCLSQTICRSPSYVVSKDINLIKHLNALFLFFGDISIVVHMNGFDGSTRSHAHGHTPVGQEANVQSNEEETLEGTTDRVGCHEASNCTDEGHGDEMVYELRAEIALIVMSKVLMDNVIAKEDGSTDRHMSWRCVLEQSEQK